MRKSSNSILAYDKCNLSKDAITALKTVEFLPSQHQQPAARMTRQATVVFIICLLTGAFAQDRETRQRRQFSNEIFSRPRRPGPRPGEELIFSRPGTIENVNARQSQFITEAPEVIDGTTVFINNRPTVATVPPFSDATTPSPSYMRCFNSCPTTNEYNPVCGSNRQIYFNEQKFNCALRCGADIQIVRRGSCEGLFPVQRG